MSSKLKDKSSYMHGFLFKNKCTYLLSSLIDRGSIVSLLQRGKIFCQRCANTYHQHLHGIAQICRVYYREKDVAVKLLQLNYMTTQFDMDPLCNVQNSDTQKSALRIRKMKYHIVVTKNFAPCLESYFKNASIFV